MKYLILSEWQRLVCRKRTVVLAIITVVSFLLICVSNFIFKVGFYDPMISTGLNRLNFTPFVLRDFHFFLVLVFCPLLVVESFNKERRSGEYRMVMIRSYSKGQLFVAKLVSLISVMFVLIICLWIVSLVFAHIMFPAINETIFFTEQQFFSIIGTQLFNVGFYLVEFLILVAICGIISLISLICPNSITSYLGAVFVLIFIGFGYPPMEFLITSTKSIFDLLLQMNQPWHVILNLVIVLVIGIGGSHLIYQKEDYLS